MWMEKAAKMRQDSGQLYRKATLHSAWATLRAMVKRAVIMRDLAIDRKDKAPFLVHADQLALDGLSRPQS
jgi:hypothetical protein